MSKFYRLKNWEAFLIIILLPALIRLNLALLTSTLLPSIVFTMIWLVIVSFWFYQLTNHFSTGHLSKFELGVFKINLVIFNILFIAVYSVVVLWLYTDISGLDVIFEYLSQVDVFLKAYMLLTLLAIPFTASRILIANKLQKRPELKEYYKRTISFLLFPIGIFWIQNEIIKLSKQEFNPSKIRGSVLIGSTLLMCVVAATSLSNSEFHFDKGDQNSQEWMDANPAFLKIQQQNDSLFQNMEDSTKAYYISLESINQYNAGNYRNAVNYLTTAIELDSLNALYYYSRGVILSEQFDKHDSAITDMSIAIDLKPTDWKAYFKRSYCNFLLGKHDLAFADIETALNFNEEQSNSFLLRGMIKEQLMDTTGACKDFMKADSLGNADAFVKVLNTCY